MSRFPVRAATAGVLLPLLLMSTGCTSPGAADDAMRRDAATASGLSSSTVDVADATALAARVDELLAKPLAREDAVTVALLNNPRLAQRFAGLRIDAAERVRASRPPNPSFTLAKLDRGSERETEGMVSIDLIGLLAWPVARGAADRQFTAAREHALADALALVRDTRAAWVDAIAATAALRHAEAVHDAAETGRLYADRLADAGNASRLDAARARAFQAEAGIALTRAQADANAAREALLRLLGIDDPARLQLPTTLPPLPETPLAQQAAEQRGIDNRFDVQAARRHADATAKALNLNRATRIVNVLEVGYQQNTSNVDADQTGFEVTLELPLFDFGSASGGEARARYDSAVANVAAVAGDARSDVRLAWRAYRDAWDIARRYRDEVLPLTSDISREMILRHNGMLVGPFELLDQAREQAGATARAQEALRDFWLADARLAAALTGAAPGEMP